MEYIGKLDPNTKKVLEYPNDAVMLHYEARRAEKGDRSMIGNKDPRCESASSAQIAGRRGVYADMPPINGDEAQIIEAFSLAAARRFTSWAEASCNRKQYRGLGLGQ